MRSDIQKSEDRVFTSDGTEVHKGKLLKLLF
jgi:hypothetical protein